MLNEISQAEKEKYYMISLIHGIKKTEIIKSEQISGCQGLGVRSARGKG